jgi:hypothetical protein
MLPTLQLMKGPTPSPSPPPTPLNMRVPPSPPSPPLVLNNLIPFSPYTIRDSALPRTYCRQAPGCCAAGIAAVLTAALLALLSGTAAALLAFLIAVSCADVLYHC